MSMYGDFLKEFIGDELLEDGSGWVQYRYLDKAVYIVNIYVQPKHRKRGAATTLADMVVEIARLRGCTELIGTVVPGAKNSTESLKVLLGYDMELKSSGENLIVFRKGI